MISFINLPENVGLSKNIIPIKAISDKYVVSAPIKQVLKIHFKDNTSAGKTIVFTWNDFTTTLTFVSGTPTSDGNELPLYNASSAGGYASLLGYIGSNYYLYKYFDMTSTITLVGSLYELELLFTQKEFNQDFKAISIVGNDATKYVPSILTAQANTIYNPNFRLLADVYEQSNVSGAREFTLIAEMESAMDKDDIAEFNIGETLDKWQKLYANFPEMGETTIQGCDNVLRGYWLMISESYGEPDQAKGQRRVPNFISAPYIYNKVLKGGVPFLKYPGNTFWADYCDAAEVKFLTNKRSGKTRVCQQQKHWLYFYNKTANSNLKVSGVLTLENGSTVNFTYGLLAGSSAGERVYRAPVGFMQMGLHTLLAGDIPQKYEVWISNNSNTQLSEKFTFLVDIRNNEFNNFIYYHNALGGVDTLWLTGECAKVNTYIGTEVQLAIANNYTIGNAQMRNNKTRLGYIFDTGYKANLEEITQLEELINSDDVRWLPDSIVKPGYTDLIKIIVDKESASDMPTAGSTKFSLNFKAKEAHYEW